ncbi:MAG: glycosyltransferase family 39 protein [Elusimicrobiota bacterium]|jgi:hypothetical protein
MTTDAPPAADRPKTTSWTLLLAGLLCAAGYGLLVSGMRSSSAVYDETGYLPAGYSYLRWGDRRLNPEHPPLTKLLAALPLLSMGLLPESPAFGPGERTEAPGSVAALKRAWLAAKTDVQAQCLFGHHFLYGLRPEALRRLGVERVADIPTTRRLEKGDFLNDPDRMLLRARLACSAFWLLLVLFVFLWARELHGGAGGVFALALAAFDPNLLAHGALATTDAGAAAFLFGALYFFWRSARRLDLPSVAGFLACFALSFATKHTAVLLPLLCAAAGAGRVLSAEPWPVGAGARAFAGRGRKALVLLGLLLAGALCAYAALWAAYGFRFSAMKGPGSEPLPLESVLAPGPSGASAAREETGLRAVLAVSSLKARAARWASARRLLPEAYLYGMAYADRSAGARGAFLLGRRSERGWWYYFPAAFLFKTPLLAMLAAAAGLLLLARRPALTFLLGPILVYMAAAMSSHLNIGLRHILPVYPFLHVAAGALAEPWSRWRPALRRPTAAAALALVALSSSVVFAPPWRPAVVAPHFLSYFNELAGGPRRGWKVLVDSNLDWGQDLGGLGRWLEARGVTEPIGLCYFGMADPRWHRIAHVNLPCGYPFEEQKGFDRAPRPGYLAVSATHLQGVYLSPELRAEWARFLKDARLVDVVGGSIFVYRL